MGNEYGLNSGRAMSTDKRIESRDVKKVEPGLVIQK